MFTRQILVALAAAVLSLSASADPDRKAAAEQSTPFSTPAASIDNGLGELSPFSASTEAWVYVYAQPAEDLDSGLGSLPPYAEWQYAWVYATPAEKIDSGLGEIRPITLSTGDTRIH